MVIFHSYVNVYRRVWQKRNGESWMNFQALHRILMDFGDAQHPAFFFGHSTLDCSPFTSIQTAWGWNPSIYRVVPQFGIAKLVNISPISLWFLLVIYLYLWDYNPFITGGAPPCREHITCWRSLPAPNESKKQLAKTAELNCSTVTGAATRGWWDFHPRRKCESTGHAGRDTYRRLRFPWAKTSKTRGSKLLTPTEWVPFKALDCSL